MSDRVRSPDLDELVAAVRDHDAAGAASDTAKDRVIAAARAIAFFAGERGPVTSVLVIALGEPREVGARASLTVGELVADLRREGRVDAFRQVHVTDNAGRDVLERDRVVEVTARGRGPLYVSYPIGWGG